MLLGEPAVGVVDPLKGEALDDGVEELVVPADPQARKRVDRKMLFTQSVMPSRNTERRVPGCSLARSPAVR